jgi:hypothetical protein
MTISKRSRYEFFKVGDIAWIPYEENGSYFVVKGIVERFSGGAAPEMTCSCKVDSDVFDIRLENDDPVFFTKNEATAYYDDKGIDFKVFEDNSLTSTKIREAEVKEEVTIKVGHEDGLPTGVFKGTLSKITEANDGKGSKLYYYHGKVEGAPKDIDGRDQEFDIILTNCDIHAIGSKIAEQYRVILIELNTAYQVGRRLNEQGIYDTSYLAGDIKFKERWE